MRDQLLHFQADPVNPNLHGRDLTNAHTTAINRVLDEKEELQGNVHNLENTVSENQRGLRRQLVQMNGNGADQIEPHELSQTHQRALDHVLDGRCKLQDDVNNLRTRLDQQNLERDELLTRQGGVIMFENENEFTHAQVNTQSGVNPVHVTGQTRPRAVNRLTDVEVNEGNGWFSTED